MILEVLLVFLIVWYIAFHIKRRRLYKLAAEYDGPQPLPIIGNALKCLVPNSEIASTILKGARCYKSPIRFWFGPSLVIYISNPEDIRTVLNSPHALNKVPYMYRLLESITGRGILTLPVQEWKRNRRLISSNFNQYNLERAFSVVLEHSRQLVNELKKEGKEMFDVEGYFTNCMLNIVCESILGFKLNQSCSIPVHKLGKLFKILSGQMAYRMTNILYLWDCLYNMSSSQKIFMKAKRKYDEIIKSIIGTWKDVLTSQHVEDRDSLVYSGSSAPRSFVEHLLSVSDEMGKLSMEELQGEVNTILSAGFEGTSNMMAFLMIALGMYEDVQEMVYKEISQLLGPAAELRFEDLKNFSYLERVIKESLRIFPATVGISRCTDQEIILNERQVIPANTNVFIGFLSLHRDPNIWPNPTHFDPNRFLPEEVAKRHPYSWIPFSAGPRNCIGLHFGMQAMKVLTIKVLQKYKIRTIYEKVEDVKLTTMTVLKATNGFKISLTDR